MIHTKSSNVFLKVPVQTNVRDLKVIIRGQEFEMKEVRKVMIKSFTPQTLIQTDKPIYLPGQTGKYRNSSESKTLNCQTIVR